MEGQARPRKLIVESYNMAIVDNLTTAYTNYSLILVALTQVIANPSQANIEAVVLAATNAGVVTPKPTYSVDGKNYDWVGYQKFIIDSMDTLRQRIQDEGGPFQLVTRGIGG